MRSMIRGYNTLRKWQQRLELLGYRLEGLHINKFAKGRELANGVTIACTEDDYQHIVRTRGAFWDSAEKMEERISKLPQTPFVARMETFFLSERQQYYEYILSL